MPLLPPKPPKAEPTRPYERSAAPLKPAPAPLKTWALGLVSTKRLGNEEMQVVAYEIEGDRCVPHPLPEGNYPRLEDALADLKRCAVQGFRFKKWSMLVLGRGG